MAEVKRTSKKLRAYWGSLKGNQPKNMEGLKLGQGWNKKEQKVEMILCACGCGEKLNKYDKKNRIRKMINGHQKPKYHFKKGKHMGIEFKKGQVGWNKGKTKTEDSRIAQPWLGKKRRDMIGNKWNIGKIRTKEQKYHLLEGMKKRWLSKEPTSIEKKVYEELKNRGILFESQKVIEGKFVVDAYIPILNLVIEADGEYWHSLPKSIKTDKSRDAYLKKCGYQILRLSETEINNGTFKERLVF